MGESAGSLAYERNQPPTAIFSNAQAGQRFMAANPADLDEVCEILKDIIQDNSRAGEVISRLRALLKAQEVALLPLALSTVICDVVLLFHSDAILHKIRISLDLDPSLPPVQGDKVELQQVVRNLLLNAFEAMKDCPGNQREINVRAAM